MDVALVTVGDELLAGETSNANAAWLGARLTDRGVDIERIITIPDRIAEIARVVNECRAAYDAAVVTGGLGPTHDDVTMAGVAAAVGVKLERSEAARQWLKEETEYEADNLAPGTTKLPAGAELLANPAGVAPGCVIENVYVLPGPPPEMRATFGQIEDEFQGRARHVETVLAAEPESALLDRIAAVRSEFDVEVGCYPGETVRLRIESGTPERATEAAAWLRDRVKRPESVPGPDPDADGTGHQ
jgi:competence/damage-inducible protein cinA